MRFGNKTVHQTAKVKVTAKMREILNQRFPARRSPNIPKFMTPQTESGSASDGTIETLSPWCTSLPVNETPANHQSPPEI